jgi:hypothetical protein
MNSNWGFHDATFPQNSQLFNFTLIRINSLIFNTCIPFLELEVLTISCKAIHFKNPFIKLDDIYTVKLGYRDHGCSDNLAIVLIKSSYNTCFSASLRKTYME